LGTVKTVKIGAFNPLLMRIFKCPACGSAEFAELKPYGGVWCSGCNAHIIVRDTCDGLNKVAVRVETADCWKEEIRKKADVYATSIWEGDDEISWLVVKDGKLIER